MMATQRCIENSEGRWVLPEVGRRRARSMRSSSHLRHEDTDGKQEESRKCHAKGCHGGVSSMVAMCEEF